MVPIPPETLKFPTDRISSSWEPHVKTLANHFNSQLLTQTSTVTQQLLFWSKLCLHFKKIISLKMKWANNPHLVILTKTSNFMRPFLYPMQIIMHISVTDCTLVVITNTCSNNRCSNSTAFTATQTANINHQKTYTSSKSSPTDEAARLHIHTRTHTQPFNGLLSGTTRVGRYQKKHSPTHTHPDHRTSFIIFLYLQRSMASSLLSLRAWQSSRTTSLQVLFGLPLGLGPSTSYSIHFFTQSSSSFRSTCPYQCSLFCCNTNAVIYT